MSEQTLSEEQVREAILTPAQTRQKLGKLAQYSQIIKAGERVKKKAEKAGRKRVLKPKPKRRPVAFCTVISIAGVPVEEDEDDYIYFD